MKKLLVAFVAVVAISFASCVNGNTEKTAACDSTKCEKECGACKCDSRSCGQNPCTCAADTAAVDSVAE